MSNRKIYVQIPVESVFTGLDFKDGRRLPFNMTVAKGRFLLSILSDVEIVWRNGSLTEWQRQHISDIFKELVGGNTTP